MSTLKSTFEAARRRGVPILVVRTSDQSAAVETLKGDPKKAQHPYLQWDAVRGLTGLNDLGTKELQRLKLTSEATTGFVDALLHFPEMVQSTVIFAYNAHRQLQSSEPIGVAAAIQAVANTREPSKAKFKMLVLLGPYGFIAPPELEQDVVVIDEGLPGEEQLGTVVKELFEAAKQPKPDAATVARAVEAVSGLTLFAAEQQTALSFTETGQLDFDQLWERKRVTIEQTRGLSVWRGGERFSDLVGLGSIKAYLERRLTARTPVGVCVFMDEIDKVLANVEGDTSGVRMDQLRTLLTEMENNEWRGIICVGVAGGGKSAIAKAFGNEAGVPTIALDLGGMESKYVGDSEAALRQAIHVIKAIGRKHAYFIATSNNASIMRPELQRRFTGGMWFFDLMSREERDACWRLYLKKYELKGQPLPNDDGWTGAEIRNCCREAWDTNCTLREAALTIVPMSVSRADAIEQLRQYANGRFLDANQPGPYRYSAEPMRKASRQITLEGVPDEMLALAAMAAPVGKAS